MKEDSTPILVLLGIIAIAMFGGVQNSNNAGPVGAVQTQDELSVDQKIVGTQNEIDNLKKQLQIEEDKKNQSQYKGMVTISNINRSDTPGQEFITIRASGNNRQTILVTGWTLKSISSGNQVKIPKGTYLFFSGMLNMAGETLHLITGVSPIGVSFKTNKCSGYLGQFQTFVPYLYNKCPLPRDEDLSSIPKLVINDACLDYIESMNSCKVQTEPLPTNWSYECTNFIQSKLNYPSCVNTYKNDKDFYQNEWRVYLKRSEKIWRNQREVVVLYDEVGKVVDTLKY